MKFNGIFSQVTFDKSRKIAKTVEKSAKNKMDLKNLFPIEGKRNIFRAKFFVREKKEKNKKMVKVEKSPRKKSSEKSPVKKSPMKSPKKNSPVKVEKSPVKKTKSGLRGHIFKLQ